MIEWHKERPKILRACSCSGIDPAFIMAIRRIEDDREAGDFGAPLESAPDWPSQLQWAIETCLHLIISYPLNPLAFDEQNRLKYSDKWIAYFACSWAPTGGVDNHPLYNRDWYPRFLELYAHERESLQACRAG